MSRQSSLHILNQVEERVRAKEKRVHPKGRKERRMGERTKAKVKESGTKQSRIKESGIQESRIKERGIRTKERGIKERGISGNGRRNPSPRLELKTSCRMKANPTRVKGAACLQDHLPINLGKAQENSTFLLSQFPHLPRHWFLISIWSPKTILSRVGFR